MLLRLPFRLDPPIVAYQYHAFPFGILFLEPSYRHDFFSRYGNIYYDREDVHRLDVARETWYTEMAYFERNRIGYQSKEMLCSQAHLTALARHMLAAGYYVNSLFNARYQPNRHSYLAYSHTHDIFLYGFDEERDIFIGAGYDKNGRYGEYEISSTDFYQGLLTLETDNWLHFLKVREGYPFVFDGDRLRRELGDFLRSAGSYDCARSGAPFGLAVYEALEEDIRSGLSDIPLGCFRLLWEHKKCMGLRLAYLREEGYVADSALDAAYAQVIDDFAILFRLAVKNSVCPSPAIAGRMLSRLAEGAEREERAVTALLSALDR